MKALFIILSLVVLNVSCTSDFPKDDPKVNTFNLKFLTKAEAEVFQGSEDIMIRKLSAFDLEIFRHYGQMSLFDIQKFFADQTLAWSNTEKEMLNRSLDTINRNIIDGDLRFSSLEAIKMIKSTMAEFGLEPGGYTRDMNIILSAELISSSPGITGLLAHEIFHVLTRNDPEFRRKMYAVIGFEVLPRELQLPNELRDRLLCNPDVDRHDSYATFTIDGKKRDCAMVMYANRPCEGGSMFDYLNIGLVEIDKVNCRAIERDGKAVIYSITDATDFLNIVRPNSSYLLDPEEIMADNFTFLLDSRKVAEHPEVIKKMAAICK